MKINIFYFFDIQDAMTIPDVTCKNIQIRAYLIRNLPVCVNVL